MAKLDDQLAAVTAMLTGISTDVDAISAEVGKVSADTDSLLAQVANVPRAGLTPEQQSALDGLSALAQSIKDKTAGVTAAVKALDDKVPEPNASPETVVEQAQAAQS